MSPNSKNFHNIPPAPEVINYIERQFGMPGDMLDGYQWFRRSGSQDVWLTAARWSNPLPGTVHSVGIRAFRKLPPAGYPTSSFLRRFHHVSTKGVLELPTPQARRFAQGQDITYSTTLRGYIIVRHNGLFLGRGFARSGGTIDSQVARQFRMNDKDSLVE